MADQEEKSAENNLNATPKKSPLPSGENAITTGGQEKHPETKCKEQCDKHQITINVPPTDNSEAHEIARQANTIAKKEVTWLRLSVWVNGILVFCTFGALFLTNQSVQISSDALQDARSQRFTDSVERFDQRREDRENTLKSFKIDSLSVDAQIKSLNEAANQFAVGNEPFLQIVDVQLENVEIGKLPSVSFQIINLGNYPVKVVRAKTATTIRQVIPPFKDFSKYTNAGYLVNQFVAKGVVSDHYRTFHKSVVNQAFISALKNQTHFFYFSGEIEYENLIDGSSKIYKFMIQLGGKENQVVNYLTNENIKTAPPKKN